MGASVARGSCQVMAAQLQSVGLRNATVGLGGLVSRVPAEWDLRREPSDRYRRPSLRDPREKLRGSPRPGQGEMVARSRHRNIQEAAFHVDSIVPARLVCCCINRFGQGKSTCLHACHPDSLELQSLGAMHRTNPNARSSKVGICTQFEAPRRLIGSNFSLYRRPAIWSGRIPQHQRP